MKRFVVIIIVFSCIMTSALSSKVSNYYFKNYKVEDGLSQNSVFCIHQDTRGFMWFGTNDGLNRFDGNSFKIYRKTDSPNSIGNSKIVCMVEDYMQQLYIGTAIGIYIYNPIKEYFTFLSESTSDNATINSRVNSMAIDNNQLWIATNNQGIFVYDIKEKKLVSFDEISNNRFNINSPISDILIDRNSNVWFISDCLYLFNQSSKQLKKYKPINIEGEQLAISKLYQDSYGSIWLGTQNNGLQKFNRENESFQVYFGKDSEFYISHIHDLIEFSQGVLAIGSNSGLVNFDIKTGKYTLSTASKKKGDLSDNSIYCFYRDKEDAFWLGTYFGGVNYLNFTNSRIELYTPGDSEYTLKGHAISRFYEDELKNIWITTEDAGINYFDTKSKKFIQYFSNMNVQSLLITEKYIWLGTYGQGILIVDKINKRPITYKRPGNKADDFSGLLIKSIFKDSSGEIWIGSNIGLFKYNDINDSFDLIEGTDKVFVWDIQEDKNEKIWFVSSGNGVFRYDKQDKQLNNYKYSETDKKSISDNFVLTLYKDNNQDLWFGTEESSFCKYNYDTDDFLRFDHLAKFSNRLIYSIISDNNNNIWFSTSNGLYSFNPLSSEVNVFTVDEGLQSNQFNFNSGFKASNGKLYFGGVNGFNAFFPEDLKRNTYVPPVHFTNFQLFNQDVQIDTDNSPLSKSLDYTNKIILTYRQNIINFEFVALSYANPQKNSYAYMMEGFDTEWSNTDINRVTYTSLPPGKYIFKVKGANNDGVWNEKGSSVEIEIKPPFWRTTIAFIFYFLIISGILYYINRQYIYRERKKQYYALQKVKTEKELELYNSKMNFFTNIVHEIKTPLSLIKAPLEKILTEKTEDKVLDEDLRLIERNTNQLNELIIQLLDFRKAESGTLKIRFSLSNISELLENLYLNFQLTAKTKDIFLILNMPEQNFYANIDQDAFGKIMANLLSNAIKFTKSRIEVNLIIPNNNEETFRIEVVDDGWGIPDKEKEKIFHPFHQVSKNQEYKNTGGVGIGLSYSRSLAELHNGSLTVSNNLDGKGSVFSLILPCRQENTYNEENPSIQQHPLDPQPIEEQETDRKDKQVLLIIEDNDDMRNFLVRSLKNKYNVLSAINGREALNILNNQIPDMIITDIMMPVMDGIEFTKIVKDKIKWSHIPLIILTAKTENDAKIKGYSIGADAYIDKPFSIELLKSRIENLFENRNKIKINFTRSPYTQSITIANNKMDEEFISRMKRIIVDNIQNESFSVDELARHMSMSRSALFAKIKGMSGMSPLDYIKIERLKRAAELLIEEKYSLSDIAFMVGYSTPSYFSKAFQKQFGVLPKDFKKE